MEMEKELGEVGGGAIPSIGMMNIQDQTAVLKRPQYPPRKTKQNPLIPPLSAVLRKFETRDKERSYYKKG